jgi:hypothetical protein
MTMTNKTKPMTNYERLTTEAKRLDNKLARYMAANGLDLDDVKAEIENKTCRLPSRVRQYVVAYFRVNEFESKRLEHETECEIAKNSVEQIKSGSIGVPNIK